MQAFWDITKADLAAQRAQGWVKDRELEEAQVGAGPLGAGCWVLGALRLACTCVAHAPPQHCRLLPTPA